MRLRTSAFVWLFLVLLAPSHLRAENEGVEKLDQATDAKIGAQSPADLGKVIELCEQAIELGLDEPNAKLANQILAASAFQRAQLLWQQLPRIASNPAAVGRLRERTVEDLEKAVAANPNLPDALILMAKIKALAGGSRSQAKEHVDQAIELLKDKPVDLSSALILRAGLRESNEEKLEDLQKAIEADSTNTDAWQARVMLQMSMGKLQEAVDDAERLLEKDEDNMFAIGAAIQSLLGLQKVDEAIKLLSARIDKTPENGAFYRERARAYRLKSYQDDLGEEEQRAAQDAAFDDLNKAIELNNRDYEALVMRGEIHYLRGDTEKANRDISDSLLIEPNSVGGVMMRSMVAAREQRYSDAITDMEMLVRASPTNTAWIKQLANYYQLDDRPRLAIRLLSELIESDPKDWESMRYRGDALLSVGEHANAIADYEAALKTLEEQRGETEDDPKLDYDYSGLLNNLSWVFATSPNEELRDATRALELGLKACEVTDYKAPHILSTLAAAYAENGDFENARKWSAKSVELASEDEDGDQEQLEHLKKELESYQQDKPWREEQEVEENKRPIAAASETIDT
ncbi:tetratricopeptide repeat protein [Aureliella helgolandensis]|uniref:Invasion protein regulator n=1 Tax=Aureliella helgolandensis TaxID=2527968 RepID=A0A518G711_9BACT|nr:tetratricopeptide repeat protein [Aureliella helgolandensis]QDV24373.1 invasion protein regulator [Aureliella helgolandensis]